MHKQSDEGLIISILIFYSPISGYLEGEDIKRKSKHNVISILDIIVIPCSVYLEFITHMRSYFANADNIVQAL